MTNDINTSMALAAHKTSTNSNSKGSSEESWFESMANAWGTALDSQANRISDLSLEVGDGLENPAQITELTAESLRMSFLSNSSHTSLTSVGSALETLARKQ